MNQIGKMQKPKRKTHSRMCTEDVKKNSSIHTKRMSVCHTAHTHTAQCLFSIVLQRLYEVDALTPRPKKNGSYSLCAVCTCCSFTENRHTSNWYYSHMPSAFIAYKSQPFSDNNRYDQLFSNVCLLLRWKAYNGWQVWRRCVARAVAWQH